MERTKRHAIFFFGCTVISSSHDFFDCCYHAPDDGDYII